MLGDGTLNYLWEIKAVLRGFELVSRLGINYHQSKLIGININWNFLAVAASFLSCRTEAKKFKFLGIFIGSNPQRISSWRPLLENNRRRWKYWNDLVLEGGLRF